MDHIFEPFFSTTGQGLETGLGLPIAGVIVRAKPGGIEMLSVPGQGSGVIVCLPLAGTCAASPTAIGRDPTPEAGEHAD